MNSIEKITDEIKLSKLETELLQHVRSTLTLIESEQIMIDDHYRFLKQDLINSKGCSINFGTYRYIIDRITSKGMLKQSYNPLSFYHANISITEKGYRRLGISEVLSV